MSPADPFDPPQTEPTPPPPSVPDVPEADVLEPEPLGPLVQLASAPTVLEAELLRAHLVNAGIRVALRDKYAIGTDPLLATALNGVKVLVGADDATRAQELLARRSRAHGPVFRVDARAAAWSTVAGLGIGTMVGLALTVLVGPSAVPIAGLIGGVIGAVHGQRVESYCTGCQGPLTAEATVCPRCGGKIAGVLRDPNDRLEAEERLRAERTEPAD